MNHRSKGTRPEGKRVEGFTLIELLVVTPYKFLRNYTGQVAMRKSRGFTLIELLVVIAVIGMLASIVLVSLGPVRAKARDARRQSDISQIELALRLYYTANETYPISRANYYGGSADNWEELQPFLTPYLSKIPLDPINDGNTGHYYYYARGDGAWIASNGWTKLTAACANKRMLVVGRTEKSASNRQDCPLTDAYGISIILPE